MLGTDREMPLICRDKAVLQSVRNAHGRIESDNPRSTFERMGRPHHRFNRFGGSLEFFNGKDAGREDCRLALRLEPKQLKH